MANFPLAIRCLGFHEKGYFVSCFNEKELMAFFSVSRLTKQIFSLHIHHIHLKINFRNVFRNFKVHKIFPEHEMSVMYCSEQRKILYFYEKEISRQGNSKKIHLGYDLRFNKLIALVRVDKTPKITQVTKISHPNMLTTRSLNNHHMNYVVMPWATGGNLLEFLTNTSYRFFNVQLYEHCLQLALAVQQIHQEGFVHCDIRFKNALVFHNRIQLAGLETCKKIGEFTSWQDWEEPERFPPESLEFMKINPALDIWCLAIIFVNICTRGRYKAPHEKIMQAVFDKEKWHRSSIYGEYLGENQNPDLEILKDHAWIEKNIPLNSAGMKHLKPLLMRMLHSDFQKRPQISQVIRDLKKMRLNFYSNIEEVSMGS